MAFRQRITFVSPSIGPTAADAGSYVLADPDAPATFTAFDYNEATADIETELETEYGGGNVDVSGTPGTQYLLEIVGAPRLVVDSQTGVGRILTPPVDSDFTDGDGGSQAAQVLTFDALTDFGSAQLRLGGSTAPLTVPTFTASDLETALESIFSIAVAVTGAWPEYTITWDSNGSQTPIAMAGTTESDGLFATLLEDLTVTIEDIEAITDIAEADAVGIDATFTAEWTETITDIADAYAWAFGIGDVGMRKTWKGDTATLVAMVRTFQVTTYDVGTTYTLTRTGEDGSTAAVSVIAAGTVNDTATALAAAWNASANRLLTPITALASTDTVTLTADTAGVPFVVAGSVAGATGTMGTGTTTVANAGPNDYGCATNWAEGAIPAASDDVLIQGAVPILYGLDQSAIEVDNFTVDPRFTAAIGSAEAFLKIDMDNAKTFEFAGSGLAYIDFHSATPTNWRCLQTRSVSGLLQAALHIRGSGLGTIIVAAGVVKIMAGTTVSAIEVKPGATCIIERDVTYTTLNTAGTTTAFEGGTTLAVIGGRCQTWEGFTNASCDVGSWEHLAGNVTNLYADGGQITQSGNIAGRTVTNLYLRGAEYIADWALVAHTNIFPSGPTVTRLAA